MAKFAPKLEDYDKIECSICNKLVKPHKVNKDGSVRYICTNKKEHPYGSGSYLQDHKFTILENGEFKD